MVFHRTYSETRGEGEGSRTGTKSYISAKSENKNMKKRELPLVEMDSSEVESIDDIAYGLHYRVKGGIQVESNLLELAEEMELNTKVQIIGKEAEIPVDESIYEKLKGKRIKVVMKE